MNLLDGEKIPYPCGKECAHKSDLCPIKYGCTKWREWFSAKWLEVTGSLKGTEKQKQKTIAQKEKLNAILDDKNCPVAFSNEELQEKTVEWLLSCGVMVPPCKVGDVLWFVGENGVESDVVEKIQFVHTGVHIPRKPIEGWVVFGEKSRFHDWEFESTVFLNKIGADRLANRLLKGKRK